MDKMDSGRRRNRTEVEHWSETSELSVADCILGWSEALEEFISTGVLTEAQGAELTLLASQFSAEHTLDREDLAEKTLKAEQPERTH